MRTLFNGEFSVDYGQMYIDSRAEADIHEGPEAGLHECFMGQQAGLCGAAVPGHLFLLTGISEGSVPLTVELHEAEPPLDFDGWEDIVETPFRAASNDTTLNEWDGEGRDLGLPAGTYRARYHCRGMDEAVGLRLEDEAVLDEYLLQFWPAPHESDRVVKQTSESAAYWHQFASELPPPPTPEELAEAERLTREKEEQDERERRERAEKREWGGRLPSDRLRSVGKAAAGLRTLDVALVHAVDEAGPETQRAIARWAAHRSCDVAGLSGADWIARGLAGLDRGLPFSPPLDDPKTARNLLSSDPQIPHTVITRPDGTSDSQQEVALFSLIIAADPDPLKALLLALHAAAGAHGTGWHDLLTEVRSEFPETAHVPLPPETVPPKKRPHYGNAIRAVAVKQHPGEEPQR
ncbi:hypothetical protein OIE63_04710 [Streptomyces sp. NBC_01795]|uniref:hypothetical protein n=1 Tax=Streptomyces sp. NBC_01795 TaxID=2975943 RepID=UPI002DDA4993|nr:hypothetical protein [Streptomyces sp. NBC_01795]WSA90918.1 hypothetical protein OIE63_04710 [Streptomyces sp. NBC_01795]